MKRPRRQCRSEMLRLATQDCRGSGLAALLPVRTRPPGPAALHGDSLAIPMAGTGGATAALPSCYARTRPPRPAVLHGDSLAIPMARTGGAAASLPFYPCAQGRRGRRPSMGIRWRYRWRELEGQRPRCLHATRAQGRRGRRPCLVAGFRQVLEGTKHLEGNNSRSSVARRFNF